MAAPPQAFYEATAVCRTGRSVRARTPRITDHRVHGIGVRCGITSGAEAALVTLDYSDASSASGSCGTGSVGRAESEAPASPTDTPPQVRDTAAGPHRNPTDETAHSGTLVMRVKSTENTPSAAPIRASWADGVFPGKRSRDDRAPEKRKLNSIICYAGVPVG